MSSTQQDRPYTVQKEHKVEKLQPPLKAREGASARQWHVSLTDEAITTRAKSGTQTGALHAGGPLDAVPENLGFIVRLRIEKLQGTGSECKWMMWHNGTCNRMNSVSSAEKHSNLSWPHKPCQPAGFRRWDVPWRHGERLREKLARTGPGACGNGTQMQAGCQVREGGLLLTTRSLWCPVQIPSPLPLYRYSWH